MKPYLFLCISLWFYLAPTHVEAQLYQPMLKEANEWHITNCFTGCFTDRYIAATDTIVQGKSYKILDGFHYISREFLLREDVASRKIYFLFIRNGKPDPEILLYDFSVAVGDSMKFTNPISPFPSDPGFFTLDSINRKPLSDGSITRFFYWSANDTIKAGAKTAVWIEGSGSQSLINAPGGLPDINQVGKLSCHFKSGVLAYTDLDSINECIETYNLTESQIETDAINIIAFPNPLQSKFTIESQEGISRIEIFSPDGRLVFKSSYSAVTKTELDLKHLPSSMLFIHVSDALGQKHVLKVLKD